VNPVLRKLRYKNQKKVLIFAAPEEFSSVMSDFPSDVEQEIAILKCPDLLPG